MARKIYKYQLNYGLNTVLLPKGAKILSYGTTGATCVFWVDVDPEEVEASPHRFFVAFTGRNLPELDMDHKATVVLLSGIVCHVFQIKDDV